MKSASGNRVLFMTLALAGALVASGAGHAGGESFPCRWNWSLHDGLREGYVTAGSSADCGGRSGSLTLSARLLRWDPNSKTWHTDRAQTKTWRNLRTSLGLEVTEPCVTSTVRAVFGWILRDSSGAVVARNSVKTGSLKVPGPGCKIVLGNPP